MLHQEEGAQSAIHAITQGKLAPLLRRVALGVVLLGVILLYLFVQFRGLAAADAMDQAQIARNLAAGRGFATDYIRPLALWQLRRAEKPIVPERFPDISQPPLFPLLNSLPLLLVRGSWSMKPSDLTYAGDRVIAFVGIVLLLASAAATYLLARRLFDHGLAVVAALLVLVTDTLWQFSLSGLSQPLLMLLLLATGYAILRAMGRQEGEGGPPPAVLQLLLGVLFALMTYTNWLACWFFAGYLFFAFAFFRPRVLPLAAIAAFLAALAPWVVRNISVSGHPFGLALYPLADLELVRALDPDFSDLFYGFRQKFRTGVVDQLQNLFGYLGLNLAAGAFLLSVLHPFKRPETGKFRWCILAMWVAGIAGMAAYGPIKGVIDAKQLHTVFIPIFACYGLAFLYVLWNRLGIQQTIFRMAFTTAVVFLCAIPMLLTLFAGQAIRIHWPPYVPPYIAIFNQWFDKDEALCSDMPWAVAWYAQRRTLLLPDSPQTMVRVSDYDIMGAPIRGLYLTPLTRSAPFAAQIQSGIYKPWAGLIVGIQPGGTFPLRTVVPLPVDGQCLLYTDYERWTRGRK